MLQCLRLSHLAAFCALEGERVLVAAHAVRLALVWNERSCANRFATFDAVETFFVPLFLMEDILLGA